MLAITLASQSPQRSALLARLDLDVLVQTSDVDEAAVAVPADPAGQVRTLARAKAEAVAQQRPERIVLGADTLVALDGTVFGKPGTPAAAGAMLRRLSGRPHRVLTGIAVVVPAAGGHSLALPEQRKDAALQPQLEPVLPNLRIDAHPAGWTLTAVVSSTVTFRPIGEEEIAAYVGTGEPLNKAGAYGVQGAGRRFIASLSGCYTNVVGLPLCAVAAMLTLVCGRPVNCPSDAECRVKGECRCLCRSA